MKKEVKGKKNPAKKVKNSNKKLLTVILISAAVIVLVGVILIMAGNENPKVLMKTSEGDITIELYPKEAPITVENFLTYVNEGFYSGTVFHRVISNFMIQGGGFEESGNEKNTHAPIKLESDNGLSNDKGTIAMARTMVKDSATSQFFINANDNDFLNYGTRDDGYAVFGKVTEGMGVVEKIEASATTIKHGMQDWPVKEIVIESVEVI